MAAAFLTEAFFLEGAFFLAAAFFVVAAFLTAALFLTVFFLPAVCLELPPFLELEDARLFVPLRVVVFFLGVARLLDCETFLLLFTMPYLTLADLPYPHTSPKHRGGKLAHGSIRVNCRRHFPYPESTCGFCRVDL